jgi:hypothetical protein
MKKILMVTTIGLMVAFLSAMVAPAFAAAPTVVDDAWFVCSIFASSSNPTVVPITVTPGKVWTSDDGVLHSLGTKVEGLVARSPPPQPAGATQIGVWTSEMNFVFDPTTQTGSLNMKITVVLTQTNTIKNPYGVGTLEGTLTAEVTSLNPYLPASYGPLPGKAQGYLVTTHGTGAFENAKFAGDITMGYSTMTLPPSQGSITLGLEFIFAGSHPGHPDNQGTLTNHNPGPNA